MQRRPWQLEMWQIKNNKKEEDKKICHKVEQKKLKMGNILFFWNEERMRLSKWTQGPEWVGRAGSRSLFKVSHVDAGAQRLGSPAAFPDSISRSWIKHGAAQTKNLRPYGVRCHSWWPKLPYHSVSSNMKNKCQQIRGPGNPVPT